MDKLDPKTDGSTADIVQQNLNKMKELFPSVFREGKVNFEALRETLGDYVDDRPERYSFTWNGKSRARRIAQTPSTGTLRPCPEESVNWDTTQNLFIEGDNLEVLKLLQKSYHKKVKLIYIDPPYNTGKEFIYPDKFQDNLDTYLRYTGQIDDEGFKLSVNAETSGRYHTNWLNMMLPRLKLARNLLRDDGVILISIDEHEGHNLRQLCGEVFGEENFVCSFVWNTKKGAQGMQTQHMVIPNHENIVVYSKQKELFSFLGEERSSEGFSNPDNDPRGLWKRQYLQRFGQGLPERTIVNPANGMEFTFETPYTEEKMRRWVVEGKIIFPETSDKYPAQKEFLSEYTTQKQLITSLGLYATKSSTERLYSLFDGTKIFTNPKPDTLLKYILQVSPVQPNDIVVDFFSGSCTTAHAVMQLNADDGGDRRYIMVQLPEPLDTSKAEHRPAIDFCREHQLPENIAEIGKERIRRVIKTLDVEQAEKVKAAREKLPGTTEEVQILDLGFKVFKLDASNIHSWDADFDNLEETLFNSVENIKPDRSESDVLYELLLKYGLDLAVPIEERQIAGKTVFIIGAGALIVCLADNVSLDTVEGIAALNEELKPEMKMKVVFKDSGFKDDVVKTNTVQILRQAGIGDVKSL